MGREEIKQAVGHECEVHGFLDAEAAALLLGSRRQQVPAMIDPPAVVPAPLPLRAGARVKMGRLFSDFELLCA